MRVLVALVLLAVVCGCGDGSTSLSMDASALPSIEAVEMVDGMFNGDCRAKYTSSAGGGHLTLKISSPTNEMWSVTSASIVIAGRADSSKTGTYVAVVGTGSFDVHAGVNAQTFPLSTPAGQSSNLCINCGDLSATFTVTLDLATPHGPLHVVGPPQYFGCST